MRVLLAGDDKSRPDARDKRRRDGEEDKCPPDREGAAGPDAAGPDAAASGDVGATRDHASHATAEGQGGPADDQDQDSVAGDDGERAGDAVPQGFAEPNKSSFKIAEDDNLPREANILVPDYDRFLQGHGSLPHAEEEEHEPTEDQPPQYDEQGWATLEWEPGTWPGEGDGASAPDEDDLRHHRFGLRLGRHQSGNLIAKLKARFKKGETGEDEALDLREAEEHEAAEQRIEPNERYKEIEVYPIRPPYGHIRILFDEETKEYIYQALEPVLTRTERDILAFIEESLVDSLTVSPHELEDMDDRSFITERFNDVIFDYSIILHEDEEQEDEIKRKLLYYVLRDFIGHGRIDLIMEDPYIEDISCDGPKIPVFLYHRKYESVRSTVLFPDHAELDSFVIKMAQRSSKHISIAEPILDATLPDGSRLQSTLGKEVSAGGSTFTIRKFRPDPFTPPDLVLFRTMSAEMLAYLWIAVQHSSSVLYAGGTASGKTTSLNAILLFIPPQMKIVTIEDTREVNLPHENWIAGITRHGFGPRDQFGRQAGEIDMFQLLKNALRQRPEYIIVGEVRGHEAYSLFQAMATGHAAYGTMHADSVDAVIHRLESDPINVPRNLLEALDVVSVQIQTRVGGKRVRRTKQISEIVGIDPHTKEILTNEVFRWVPKDDSFKFSGISYILERIQLEKAMPEGSMMRELSRRAAIIEWMIDKQIQDYREVSRIVSAYYREPEVVMALVEGRLSGDEIPTGLREIASRSSDDGNDDPLSAAALEASKVSSEGAQGPAQAPEHAGARPEEEPAVASASAGRPAQAPHDVAADGPQDAPDVAPEETPTDAMPAPHAAPDRPDGPAAASSPWESPPPGDAPVREAADAAHAETDADAQGDAGPLTSSGDARAEPEAESDARPARNLGEWGGAPGLLDAARAHKDAEETLGRLGHETQDPPKTQDQPDTQNLETDAQPDPSGPAAAGDRTRRMEDLHRSVDQHLAKREAHKRPAKDWSPEEAEAWLSDQEARERDSRRDRKRRVEDRGSREETP